MMSAKAPEDLQTALVKRLGLVLSKRSGLALAIWGEAGVGKSWLAQQVMQQVPCRNLTVQASDSHAQLVAALPFSDSRPLWVQQGLERLREGELGLAQAADTLAATLGALAPFVLLIEDLHEARPEQQALWLELAQEVSRVRGVGLLFTTRTPPPEPLEPYPLGVHSLEASALLLHTQTGATLPPAAVQWIYQRAQGNPLFTLEYFRHLTRLGYLWSDGQRWRWREPPTELMPTSIEALVLQLMARSNLEPQSLRALQTRALLGEGESSEALWAEVSGLDSKALQEAILYLEQAGLLVAGSFVHPLFTEVVRREIPPLDRQALAQKVIQALESRHPERAALFIAEAHLPPHRAIELLEQATARTPSERDKANFLAQAAQLSQEPKRTILALEAAQILRDFDLPAALEASELALSSNPSHPQGVLLYAEILSELGRGSEAEQALLRLTETDQRLYEAILQARAARDDFAGAVVWWNQHPQMQAEASATATYYLGRSLFRLGRFAEAKDFITQTIAHSHSLDAAWLKSLYAQILLDEGDFAEAVRVLSEAIEGFEQTPPNHPAYATLQNRKALARYSRALGFYRWGRYSQAIADLEAYLLVVSQQGDGRKFAEGQANLGLYLLELGEYERAEEVLLESRSVLERIANHRGLSIVGQGLVRLYLEWAPLHGGALALKYAQSAEFHARQTGSPPILAETLAFVAWAEAVHGQPPQAFKLVEELEQLAAGLGETRIGVFALWVWGLALEKQGQLEAAQSTISEAVGQMRELGHNPFAHRMALELDRIQGNRKAATARIASFEAMGNRNWVNIVRRYFPSTAQPLVQPEESEVRLEVLGPLLLRIQGQPIKYEARKGKELLALLLEARIAGRSEVEQLELYDTLYPEMDEEKAASALKQLVYRLRTALGHLAITRTSLGYALGAVESDAEAFMQTGHPQLWRGPYLQGIGAGWDASVGESLYHGLRQQATQARPDEALRLARILLEADPYDHEALALALRALQQDKNLGAAERFYQQQRQRFSEVGERLPERWDDFLVVVSKVAPR